MEAYAVPYPPLLQPARAQDQPLQAVVTGRAAEENLAFTRLALPTDRPRPDSGPGCSVPRLRLRHPQRASPQSQPSVRCWPVSMPPELGSFILAPGFQASGRRAIKKWSRLPLRRAEPRGRAHTDLVVSHPQASVSSSSKTNGPHIRGPRRAIPITALDFPVFLERRQEAVGSRERFFVMRDTQETLDSNCHGPQNSGLLMGGWTTAGDLRTNPPLRVFAHLVIHQTFPELP